VRPIACPPQRLLYNRAVASEANPVCTRCRDTGWVIESRQGREVAVRCQCRKDRKGVALLAACRIPQRYASCTLDNFDVDWDPGTPSIKQAWQIAKRLVARFPDVKQGLLFQGPAGIGKTHLAVASLKELVQGRGVRGLYVNFVELVQALQAAFDGGSRARDEILTPVIEADVVVLDELGAGKVSEWTMDLLYFVVNRRYMDVKLTLATTNYIDMPRRGDAATLTEAGNAQVRQAWQQESLADRIGVRVRSRLYEMCELVDMRGGPLGGDFRRLVKLRERYPQ
jgi:DNA replication protein DnaC